MNKTSRTPSTIITIVFLLFFVHFLGSNASAPVQQQNILTFYCANNTSIQASFATNSVSLILSDGRSFTLAKTISGSGMRYESTITSAHSMDTVFWNKGNNAFLTENNQTTYQDCLAAKITPSIISGYDTYIDESGTFSFTFPKNFSVAGSAIGYTQGWSALATTSGMILAKINVPKSFETGTNFGNATFLVGTSADTTAVASCFTNQSGNIGTTTSIAISGVPFTKLQFVDAGAGNYYDTTSYRTTRNNQCYAVEYTIHYTNFENYPPGMVQRFNKVKISAALDAIVQSFRFVAQ